MCTQKSRIIIFEVRDSARVRERDERCHAQGWSRHIWGPVRGSDETTVRIAEGLDLRLQGHGGIANATRQSSVGSQSTKCRESAATGRGRGGEFSCGPGDRAAAVEGRGGAIGRTREDARGAAVPRRRTRSRRARNVVMKQRSERQNGARRSRRRGDDWRRRLPSYSQREQQHLSSRKR